MDRQRYPGAALSLGVAAALLWRWVWGQAYDPELQLLTRGEGILLLLVAGAVGYALLLVWMAWPWRGTAGAFPPRPRSSALAGLAAGGCAVGSAVLLAREALAPWNLILLLLALLTGGMGVAMLFLARHQAAGEGVSSALTLLSTFASCYWLVAFYHQYGAIPLWAAYLWPLVGGLLAAWSWMAQCGRHFQPKMGAAAPVLAPVAVLALCLALTAQVSAGFFLSLLAQLLWHWSICLDFGRRTVPGE